MWIVCPIAGVGKRLQPFTYSKPKAFLKIAGKRLIDHILIKLKRTFPKGSNLLFIIGYKKRQISEYLIKNYSNYFNLQFREQKPIGYESETPYFSGLGDAILLAKEFVKNDDMFIFLSDRLPMEDYTSILLNYHQQECDGIINAKRVPTPQFYGALTLDKEGFINKIVEKPQEYFTDYAVSGGYLFGKSIVPRLFDILQEQNKKKISNGEEHQLTSAIQRLIDEGKKIKINEMKNNILDFGRFESLFEGNRSLLSEIKIKDPLYDELRESGNIKDSKIIPPVFIGKNVKIKNSIIGPNVSIGDDASLEKCILYESVIGDGANLKRIISSDSIIGDYSTLEDLIKNKITIGDSAYITTSNLKFF
ncbi:MAG: NDP-sugar synthase [Candidatus Lokiarchaeota archaeon]|nr:NDP-sugar synthase [Candidatus Lokiarchaeota archaeon]